MTQTSNKFHGKTTKIKFTYIEGLDDGNIIIGCSQPDKDSIDALVSMVGETFIIEHNGRKIKSIKLEK